MFYAAAQNGRGAFSHLELIKLSPYPLPHSSVVSPSHGSLKLQCEIRYIMILHNVIILLYLYNKYIYIYISHIIIYGIKYQGD